MLSRLWIWLSELTENKGKEHKRLTIAELRNCKGFENYSDEQAEETIKTLERLSILFYELYEKEKQQGKIKKKGTWNTLSNHVTGW